MKRILWSSVLLFHVWAGFPSWADEMIRMSTFEARDGEYLRLSLDPGIGDSWREAPVTRLAIRSGGEQKNVPREQFEASRQLDLRLEDGGCSMVLVDVAKPGAEGPLSWDAARHASKVLTCPATTDPRTSFLERQRAGAMMMAKVGGRIEIRPLANPATVRPGSDLPVRVYFDNSPREGAKIEALGPQNRRRRAVTSEGGFANFRIPVPGAWRILYRVRHQGEEYTAELRFEVLSPETWRSMLAAGGAP